MEQCVCVVEENGTGSTVADGTVLFFSSVGVVIIP